MNGERIGLIGCGVMGSAVIRRMIEGGIVGAGNVLVYDIKAAQTEGLKRDFSVKGAVSPDEICVNSDIVILAVKPADVPSLFETIQPYVQKKHLLVSLAAGISTAYIEEKFAPAEVKVIRLMPNTPCLIGKGVVAISSGALVTDDDLNVVEQLFGSLGLIVRVAERQMNAVTGLSGSGPAYVYLLIEAMADAGVEAGLERAKAMSLVTQTVLGAAEMLIWSGKHPAELKNMVTSPAGTTSAGLWALEQDAFRGSIINAVNAAVHRAAKLNQE